MLQEEDAVRATRLQRISNLGALTRFSFETFQTGASRGGLGAQRALEAARRFAGAPHGWFVLTGPSGSGKTHLAAAIANERIALSQPVLFMVVPDLLDHLRASYDPADEELNYSQLFEQVKNAPLLVLDDIDAAAGTPWAREKLFQIVNHRFNTELPTVFTTSMRPEQLDDRLRTRLADSSSVTVVSPGGPRRENYQQVGGMTRERLLEMTFADFADRSDVSPAFRTGLRRAKAAAEIYSSNPRGWLLIRGSNGCGKTHLAAAIAGEAVDRGERVVFAVVPDLLDHLRATYDPNSDARRDELFAAVRDADLLVLDDLGAHKTSAWAEEKLYQIVNYRTLAELATVVTTNLRLDELERLHPRIFTRIVRGGPETQIEMELPPYGGGQVGSRYTQGRGPSRER